MYICFGVCAYISMELYVYLRVSDTKTLICTIHIYMMPKYRHTQSTVPMYIHIHDSTCQMQICLYMQHICT